MTPGEAEEYLLGLELFGMRFGLDRMHKLMTVLGLPQRRFASVHVVGTNGKSSTTRFIAAILERHGLRTGSYTSPHLRSFRERIEVSEAPVSGERFAAAVGRAAEAATTVERTLEPDDRVTQFEALTAAAYHELAASGVQVAVIEAGLGGRHDATNVIASKVQVLTSVGLDHTRWLGPTVADIAAEKLAVVREGATLVVGDDLDPEVEAAALAATDARHATLVRVPTPGAFQRANFALAAGAAEAFLGRPLDPAAVRDAAAETAIPGRLEVVAEHPLTVLDGAHNPDGARALMAALDEVRAGRSPLVLVVSVLDDKDARRMLEILLDGADHAIFTRCSIPRSLAPESLAGLCSEVGGPPAEVVEDPVGALAQARERAGPQGCVLVTGSIHLIADLVGQDVHSPRCAL